jgi:signal transduction histidine kinase
VINRIALDSLRHSIQPGRSLDDSQAEISISGSQGPEIPLRAAGFFWDFEVVGNNLLLFFDIFLARFDRIKMRLAKPKNDFFSRMRVVTRGLIAQRKILFIFILAVLLPSLVVGYLSLSTFAKRREAAKKLLESNLWVSAEAALKSFESELLEYEKKVLAPENFIPFIQAEKAGQNISSYSAGLKDIGGQIFVLDADYQIIFPRTGSEDVSLFQREGRVLDNKFSDDLKNVELIEFSGKNYSRAADLYRDYSASSSSDYQKAMSLEGLGRSLLAAEKFDEAYEAYSELASRYPQLINNVGHPYGIGAAFQLFEIEKRRGEEQHGLKILLDLYRNIQNGTWLLNLPSYDFFVGEIESILRGSLTQEKFPETQNAYRALKEQKSSYLRALRFTDFLKRAAIPSIKEKLTLSRIEEARPERLVITREQTLSLISFCLLPEIQPKRAFYGGFCWDLDYLKKGIFPKAVERITKNSGLLIRIIDESGRDVLSGETEAVSKNNLSLSSRQFPFPWKLLISQPGLNELEKTARRENILYGMLLSVIVVFMLLGVVLIVRDMARESETTRLRTEFVHNVSHELKTPLTLIRLYGETLQRKEDLKREEKQEAYEIITKESERLSHLINNVLDFSRIEMGKKEFNFKKGNLGHAVRDTLDSYRYHLEKKGFNIQAEIAPDLPEMNFDTEAMSSVLINLLSNALKFSPGRKEVTVRLFKEKSAAVLQVEDKGIGISPGEISKIFRRFYRVKNKAIAETAGSGLGLTLVKHIAEAHGGKVKVDSQPGKGSVFSVILPLSGANEE